MRGPRTTASLLAGLLIGVMLVLQGCPSLIPNRPPVAVIEVNPAENGSPLTVMFDGSKSHDPDRDEPDGNIVSYQWDFGDGNHGSGKRVTHTYGSPGTYTVTLTVTDGSGAKGQTSTQVQVPLGDLTPSSCDVTHHGDLIVSGEDVFTIENQTYCQRGDIVVQDQAKLRIIDAHLYMEMAYRGEFSLSVNGAGELITKNATIAGDRWFHVDVLGNNASAEIDATRIDPGIGFRRGSGLIENSDTEIRMTPSVKNMKINSSTLNGLLLLVPESQASRFVGLEPGYVKSTTSLGFSGAPYNLSITDSRIRPPIHLRWRANNDLTIKDSQVFLTMVTWEDMSIQGLSSGFIDDWTLPATSSHGQLTIQDTEVDPSLSAFSGSNVSLSEVAFRSLDLGDNSTVSVDNSELGGLTMEEDSRLNAMNTEFNAERLRFLSFSGSLEMTNVSFNGTGCRQTACPWAVVDSDFTIQGSVQFSNMRIDPWRQSSLQRDFPFRVTNSQGDPIPNAEVKVENPQGEVVFDGTTDRSGEIQVPVTFTDATYDESYEVTVESSGEEASRSLTLKADAPVHIEMSP